mmetsp:Transcript_27897/g.70093  ORF Transcript_27897/g.70093 Transcript_27897/m.70093 type:complete len:116 (-) Transcript_27897:466-813(-)
MGSSGHRVLSRCGSARKKRLSMLKIDFAALAAIKLTSKKSGPQSGQDSSAQPIPVSNKDGQSGTEAPERIARRSSLSKMNFWAAFASANANSTSSSSSPQNGGDYFNENKIYGEE